MTELDDTSVTTRTVADLLCYYLEQLGNSILVLKITENNTT